MLLACLGVLAVVGDAFAQRGFGRNRGVAVEPNAAYDGRFTFARLRYNTEWRSGWEFDYPEMERNLMTMINEITSINAHQAESNVHDMDDPELLKYPIAYLSEPGYWLPSESEVVGLRTYLAKGGFLIVDDFLLGEWNNFQRQMLRVLPEADFVSLPVTDPVFNSFFTIGKFEMHYPNNPSLPAQFLGIYEGNDPTRRLLVVINYNTDVGDFMEHSGRGWWPVNVTNDAYKYATNYLVYGLSR